MEKDTEQDLPRVLVVDDDAQTRLFAREYLEQADFDVDEAGDGVEGMSLFTRVWPDIVLLDVDMPHMDGFTMCTEIRKLSGGEHTPILMMTGLHDDESIIRAYEAGATHFITKPVNWIILSHHMRYLLRASRAITSLSKSEAQQRALLDAIPDLMVQVDTDGTILEYKPGKGIDAVLATHECVGKHVHEVFPAELARTVSMQTQRVLATRDAHIFDYQLQCDGSSRYYEIRLVASSPSEIFCLVRDITERNIEEALNQLNKELEQRIKERTEELERAYDELQSLDKMKDSFLSTVSHELRTPLTSIRSFSEILLHYDEDLETRKEFLEIINSESERLTRLINDVLDLSRIEAGKMVWNDDLVSIDEIIKNVVQAQSLMLREKAIEITLDSAPELPFVFVDPDRIKQVITNLLGNAIKFSPVGSAIKIKAEQFKGKRAGDLPEWIRVTFSDQGIGIDQKDFRAIFERFSQLSTDTLKDKPKGSGLGLPICKEIITHYGGNIWVESRIGTGTNFFFTLPAHTTVDQLRIEPGGAEQRPHCWNGKVILVVDDNPNMRKLLRFQLQKLGYKVLEASDGTTAFELAQREHVDLITLDLMMPLMNGYDVLRALKEDYRTQDIPVLIISIVDDGNRRILPGANDYLLKPFQEEMLIDKVQALLGTGRCSILVVDDEPGVRELLRIQLEERGYAVTVAGDGQEAVDSLALSVPNLVVLDAVMPRKNGYEVLRWIRCTPSTQQLPVIILSAYSPASQDGDFFSLGVDAYVEKSEGFPAVLNRIDSALMSAITTAGPSHAGTS